MRWMEWAWWWAVWVDETVMVEVSIGNRHEVRRLSHDLQWQSTLISFPASEETSVVKHVFAGWIKSPVVTFSRISWLSWNFHKAVVKR